MCCTTDNTNVHATNHCARKTSIDAKLEPDRQTNGTEKWAVISTEHRGLQNQYRASGLAVRSVFFTSLN